VDRWSKVALAVTHQRQRAAEQGQPPCVGHKLEDLKKKKLRHVCICTLVSRATPWPRLLAIALDLFLGNLWLGSRALPVHTTSSQFYPTHTFLLPAHAHHSCHLPAGNCLFARLFLEEDLKNALY
jgi:hypothetical protein